MRHFTLALLLLVCPALLDAAPVALTNTRYGEAQATEAVLTSNGRDAFVLWKSTTAINITRIVDGEYRVGRAVFPPYVHHSPHIDWTGQFFLAVAERRRSVYEEPATNPGPTPAIVGRVLDAEGEPVGAVFTIAENASMPRVASNGRNVLLVYNTEGTVKATLLTATGNTVNGGSVVLGENAAYDVASNGTGFAVITAAKSAVRVTTFTATGAIVTQATVSSFDLGQHSRRHVAIASDGQGYLGVWSTRALFDAIPVDADGTLGTPFQIARLTDGNMVRAASVAWTGNRYTAAFVGGQANDDRLFVARATHRLQSVDEGRPASAWLPVSLTAAGGRTLVTWQREAGKSTLVSDISDLDGGTPVTFSATRQALGAAASLASATLVTWNEWSDGEMSLRAGIRSADGSWRERRLGGEEYAPRVAAGGTEFLIITMNQDGWSAVRVDAQLNVLSRSPRVNPLPVGGLEAEREGFSIAWNGRDYAVAYTTSTGGEPVLVRVSKTGVVSPAITFPVTDFAYRTTVASDGNNFLFAWTDVADEDCYWPDCDWETERVLAVRLRPDFTPIDPQPLVLTENDTLLFGSAWRDGAYQLFYTSIEYGAEGVIVHTVPASGPASPNHRNLVPGTAELRYGWSDLQAISHNGWLGIWRPGPLNSEATHYFPWGVHPQEIATPFREREMIVMPDGKYAWVGIDVNEAAPHHGAARLILDIRNPAVDVPGAPRAAVTSNGRELEIGWSAPAQPVAGYRVEYRIGNGSWNEFPQQFAATERSAVWKSLGRGKTYAFRVRAFNAGGVGAYSQPVVMTVNGGKRRSVR